MVDIKDNTQWKALTGYDGKYYVSRNGEIYSLYRNRLLEPSINYKGYKIIRLTHNKVTKTFILHRIIAKEYIPNPENKPEVNHINTIKTDNRIENLEWVTNMENRTHALENNLVNENSVPKAIYMTNLKTNESILVNSAYDAMKIIHPDLKEGNQFRSKYTKIREILKGKRKSHYGYTFRFIE
jgi:hypothetical protein